MSRAGGQRFLAWSCLAVSLFAAAPAAAGKDDSNALFDAGVLQMEAGRYAEACPSIEHSYELDPRPGVLYTLAECQSKWGRIAAAVTRYQQYLKAYDGLSPVKKKLQTSRPAAARAQVAALSPQVPKLTLTLAPSAPAGTVVERDGQLVPSASLGASMPVDPGDHVVRISVPGGPLRELNVTLARSESKSLVLEFPKAPVVSDPAAREGHRGLSGRRLTAFLTGGFGLAGLVIGGGMGGAALAKKGVVDDHCNVGGLVEACDHQGKAAADDLKAFALASTVGVVAGGALVVVSTVLFVTEPAAPKPAASARWIRASLVPGPTTASVLVQGTW